MKHSLTEDCGAHAGLRRLGLAALIALVLPLLTACGNKGALYLPDEEIPAQANAPATDPADEEGDGATSSAGG